MRCPQSYFRVVDRQEVKDRATEGWASGKERVAGATEVGPQDRMDLCACVTGIRIILLKMLNAMCTQSQHASNEAKEMEGKLIDDIMRTADQQREGVSHLIVERRFT